eukprot:GHVH01008803.1.p1 GENE.GHVH01008803.1~~GHVH01008803.1.p1  ORF type:complete len:708 (+),score=73.36 GHVH01008803.1:219-2342(+)
MTAPSSTTPPQPTDAWAPDASVDYTSSSQGGTLKRSEAVDGVIGDGWIPMHYTDGAQLRNTSPIRYTNPLDGSYLPATGHTEDWRQATRSDFLMAGTSMESVSTFNTQPDSEEFRLTSVPSVHIPTTELHQQPSVTSKCSAPFLTATRSTLHSFGYHPEDSGPMGWGRIPLNNCGLRHPTTSAGNALALPPSRIIPIHTFDSDPILSFDNSNPTGPCEVNLKCLNSRSSIGWSSSNPVPSVDSRLSTPTFTSMDNWAMAYPCRFNNDLPQMPKANDAPLPSGFPSVDYQFEDFTGHPRISPTPFSIDGTLRAAQYIPSLSSTYENSQLNAIQDEVMPDVSTFEMRPPVIPYGLAIISVGVKGQGLTSTVNLNKGQIISTESALMVMPVRVREKNLTRKFMMFPRLLQEKIMSLPDPQPNLVSSNIEALQRVAKHNRVDLFSTDSATGRLVRSGRGLFSCLSLINHSCTPNAYIQTVSSPIIRDSCESSLCALRDISPGEELTICYVWPSAMDQYALAAERKKFLLEQFQFVCHCDICDMSGPRYEASESNRQSLQLLRTQFKRCEAEGNLHMAADISVKILHLQVSLENDHLTSLMEAYLQAYQLVSLSKRQNSKGVAVSISDAEVNSWLDKARANAAILGGHWRTIFDHQFVPLEEIQRRFEDAGCTKQASEKGRNNKNNKNNKQHQNIYLKGGKAGSNSVAKKGI